MRIVSIMVMTAFVGACSAPASRESSPEIDTEAPVEELAVDGGPAVGRYRAVDETGFVLIEDLRENGTYTFTDEAGAILEQGTYTQKTPELPCFTPDTEGAVEKSYRDAMGSDGIWRTIDPETGVVAVIERIEGE